MKKERPKLEFSTINTLWRPDFALGIIRDIQAAKGEAKPRHFKFQLPVSCTEAEKYSAALLCDFCEYAFGSTRFAGVSARQRIASVNVAWIRHNIPVGKGASFRDLEAFVHLYSEHLEQDSSH